MRHFVAIALVLPILDVAPAAAQWTETSLPGDGLSLSQRHAPLPVRSRGIDFPVIQYTDDRGTLQVQRGIVLGTQVAPNALLGVGLFDRAPRSRTRWLRNEELRPARKSRGPAVGLTIRL